MTASNGIEPIDRNDLAMFKDWIQAEFKVVTTRLNGVEKGIMVAAKEQERRDEQLNDVRLRFLPRPEFEAYEAATSKTRRSVFIAISTIGIGLIGVGITVISLLAGR